jgi:hypothetical protein
MWNRASLSRWENEVEEAPLYPIRIKELIDFTALNYHKWSICDSALSCGVARQTTILEFCKEALIRAYGEAWYVEAAETMQVWLKEKNIK